MKVYNPNDFPVYSKGNLFPGREHTEVKSVDDVAHLVDSGRLVVIDEMEVVKTHNVSPATPKQSNKKRVRDNGPDTNTPINESEA